MNKPIVKTTSPRIEVEHEANIVRLEFHCRDIYAAMLFYDEICAAAKEGTKLSIDVEVA